MKDDLDNLKDVNDENIEEGDIGKSNDENLSDNFLKSQKGSFLYSLFKLKFQ